MVIHTYLCFTCPVVKLRQARPLRNAPLSSPLLPIPAAAVTGEVPIVPVVIVVVVVEILCCHIAFVEILQLALRANERRDLDANMFILLLFRAFR